MRLLVPSSVYTLLAIDGDENVDKITILNKADIMMIMYPLNLSMCNIEKIRHILFLCPFKLFLPDAHMPYTPCIHSHGLISSYTSHTHLSLSHPDGERALETGKIYVRDVDMHLYADRPAYIYRHTPPLGDCPMSMDMMGQDGRVSMF